jgi:outer membrane protein
MIMKTIAAMMILSALSGALFGEAAPARSDSLTVEQAVRLAVDNHPLVEQAAGAVAAADARVQASRTPRYPDVSIAGLYTRLDPVAEMDIPGMGAFKLYPANNYDVHLGVRQTIYDFGRIGTGAELAESARRTAADYVDVVKSNIAYQTVAAFDALLILQQSIDVLDEQIGALEEHLEVSRTKIEAGTATNFDSLTTAVRIAVAKNERIDAARSLAAQEIALRQLTGLPPDRPLAVKGTIAARAREFDADSVLAAAMRQRPELAAARDAESSAAVQARLASLGDRPSLAFVLSSGFKNGYVPDLDKLEANVAAGVQLSVPIFNGHRTRYQEAEAQANVRSAAAHTAGIERQVSAEVEQALAGVQSSVEKIENSLIQVRRAEAALAMADAQYRAGVATNLDMLDAQTALSQAKLVRLRALYDYMTGVNALDRASGRKIW